LDIHLPVRNTENIICEIRTLPPSKTKGLTPDMERELRNRSKNGATPTMEATWAEIYRKLFPGAPIPSSGPCKLPGNIPCCDCLTNFQIDLTNAHRSSRAIDEKEEYIQYLEQELLGLVKEELDASGEVSPEQRDLLISVLKSCQQKLQGMFLQARETSGARLASEDRSHGSMSQLNQSVGETRPTLNPFAQDYFQPDFEIANYSSDPSLFPSQFHGISTFPPDIHNSRHIPSPDSCYDSVYDSLSRGNRSSGNYSNSGSDRLVNQSSLNPTWPNFGLDKFLSSDDQGLIGPMPEVFNNSTTEFDSFWPRPAQNPDSDIGKCSSRENRE
jgi:hypothetical protein